MEGYPVPWWGWLVTLVMIVLWIGIAAGLINLVLWLARSLRLGERKGKTSRHGDYHRGKEDSDFSQAEQKCPDARCPKS